MTTEDLVNFVLANRRGKAFAGYSKAQLYYEFWSCFQTNPPTLLFSTDAQGKVDGVATGQLNGSEMYVRHILTTRKGVMLALFKKFTELWPSTSLAGLRHGRRKAKINPARFAQHAVLLKG